MIQPNSRNSYNTIPQKGQKFYDYKLGVKLKLVTKYIFGLLDLEWIFFYEILFLLLVGFPSAV